MSEQSVLGDLFPQDFKIDIQGKKFTWLGEVLIPFID
jgi:5'-3' exoribonuclease 2